MASGQSYYKRYFSIKTTVIHKIDIKCLNVIKTHLTQFFFYNVRYTKVILDFYDIVESFYDIILRNIVKDRDDKSAVR